MDRRERVEDLNIALLAAFRGMQAGVWNALPGIINSFDPVKKTCEIKPAIQGRVQNPDGSFQWVDLPLLLDCPAFFPSGGGYTLTFPIQAGDEALVVFSSRCIDAWWQLGGTQPQLDLRMHDLSDGFAFVGVSSLPNVPAAISTTSTQLRNHSGDTFVELNNGHVNITAPTQITLTSPLVHIIGDLKVSGFIEDMDGAKGTVDHIRSVYNSHDHNDPQGGVVAPPNQTL